nr:hypothetical protein [Bacilli bacterium]
MAGQIRSYISYISVDSDESYLDRIEKMISEVEDDTTRAALQLEYTNKVNQINIMKRYMAEKVSVDLPKEKESIEPIVDEEPIEKIKTFEEEMEEKIREYQNYKEDIEEKEDSLPDIYTNAYNLVKVYNMKPTLLKEIPAERKVSKVKVKSASRSSYRTTSNEFNKIPVLPIIEDAVQSSY